MTLTTSLVITTVIVPILNDRVEFTNVNDNNPMLIFHPYDKNEYDKGTSISNQSETIEETQIYAKNVGGMIYLLFLIF